ncbi:MAG: penicillin acylase family protein [Bdellovibrionales bacterium]
MNGLWIVAAAFWLAALSRPLGPLPALGPLLMDLHSGVFQHSDFAWQNHKLPGLKEPVEIAVDAAGVPHIFARSEADLYYAQGYIMASQRLFQMDLSTRSVSGHLAELVGPKGLEMDRYFVKLGMRQSGLKTVNDYMANPQVADGINAFTAGVNFYIASLKNLPVEYKLLGVRPVPFDASRVIYMARALTYSLNARGDDYALSHLAQQISVAKVLDIFPEFMPPEFSDYVLPGAWSKTKRAAETPELFKFATHLKNFPKIPQPANGNGSNNWVVGPSKSKTGHSILANDTHLGLSLPGIWFENQLSCPQFNVYGVSLPDTPGIVGGFNQSTAWGPTNGTTDALDYYEVEFTSDDSLKYLDNGIEKEAQVFQETISSSSGAKENVDVIWTKWGPVLYREGRYGLAVNWTGFQPGNELGAVRKLYDSHDVKSCLAAFEQWRVPIQNFVCADADHIGILHAGFIPKREIGEGRFIEKAGESKTELHVEIDKKYQPIRIDPREGYLRSANQRIVDQTYPYYMGWEYEEPFRGMQIRHLLEAQEKFSGEDLIRIQNDDYDSQASFTLPIMLKELQHSALQPEQQRWAEALARWDMHDRSASVEAALYKSWFLKLKHEIFDDEYDLPERKKLLPKDMRVAWMLKRVSENPQDSDAEWIDDKRTPEREGLPAIVTRAFQKSWDDLKTSFGPQPTLWTWKRYNNARVDHIAKIPGFGSPQLAMNGSAESVNGNRGWHGAVYKFVIELGPNRQAWVQTPGGSNGDPFSPEFERNVVDWSEGKMRKVKLYKDLNEAKAEGLNIFEFSPGEK